MTTLNKGSGADGNATAVSNTNLNTTSLVGRGYGDMVCYNCSSVGVQGCTVTATPNGLVVGDEVLLINIRGVGYNGGTSVANEGNYETFIISEINGNNVSFTQEKTKFYGNDGGDTNIGIDTATNQKVLLQRVPNYNNFTINNGITVTADTYGGPKGGILFCRVKDTLTINGSVNMDEKGPPGGGKKVVGGGGPNVNPDGGIGHPSVSGYTGTGGTGASHATLGGQGASAIAPTYGNQELTSLHMGSGGEARGGYAGRGGGVIAFFTHTLHFYGSLSAKGGPPAYAYPYTTGGGGSGGSILLHAGVLYMHSSSTYALSGGNGGEGRLAIYYASLADAITGTDTTPYIDSNLSLGYTIGGTLSEDAVVLIYNSTTHELITTYSGTTGIYEVNVPGEGYYDVVAKSLSYGQVLGYGNVVPNEEI